MVSFNCLNFLCVFTAAASQCLEDAVTFASLQPVRMGNRVSALGLWSQNFSSSRHTTALYALLVREVLGFRTDIKNGGNHPAPGIHALGSCFYQSAGFVCSANGTSSNYHLALDMWNSTSVLRAVEQVWSDYRASTPIDLGSMGYTGKSGVFVPSTVQTAVGANRVSLTSYLTYQSVNLTALFDKFSDLAPDKLRHCFNTALARSGAVSNYLLHSGDHAGTFSGGATARCWNSSFWLAPACRSEPERCIPVIAVDRGHAVEALMIKAASYTLPWAIAVAKDWDAYSRLVTTSRVLFYQWEPDWQYSPNAAEVLFPAYNATEWGVGNMRTSEPAQAIQKWAFTELKQVAPAAYFLAERLQLSSQSLKELMLLDNDPDKAACKWVLSKREKWQTWVPRSANDADWTSCTTGAGLLSPLGVFLTRRALTASCWPCPAGRTSESFHDSLGQTRRCIEKSQETKDGPDIIIVVIVLSVLLLIFLSGVACYRKFGCLNVCLVTATGQWGRLSRSYSERIIAWASPRGSAKRIRLPEETATGSAPVEDVEDGGAEVNASTAVPKISVVKPEEPGHSLRSTASAASSQATPQASPRIPGPPLPPKLAFTALGEQHEQANAQRRPSNASDPFAVYEANVPKRSINSSGPLQAPQHDIAATSPGGTPRVSRAPDGSTSWRRRPSNSSDHSGKACPAASEAPSPRPPSARGSNPSTKNTPKPSPRPDSSTPLPPIQPLLHAPMERS